jgi:HPt (histidine-containing phosphotransfer) domain-containing protein
MDDLIADFVAECREMREALGGEVVAWEAAPDDRARLDSIFRFVHTVKGNCGFFDFPRLEALSHAAEDALADVRAGAWLCRPEAAAAATDQAAGLCSAPGNALRSDRRSCDWCLDRRNPRALPRLEVPILVTQHLPAPFMPVLARQLAVAARREALVATDGMALEPDRILIAPGDAHLTIEMSAAGHVVRLTTEPSRSGCMPSLDPMFASAGARFGSRALGVVLTGMGRDGVDGASRLVACGGSVLAQDEESSAIWGMPRAVVEAGLACAVMTPEKIARRITSRTGDSPCR